MSIFNDLPNSFPLENSFKSLPVSYELKSDSIEYYLGIILPVFYIALTVLVVGVITGLFVDWQASIGQLAGLVVIFAGVCFFGRLALGNWRTGTTQIEVTIDRKEISTSQKGSSWRLPLTDFQGIGLENMGTHEINGDKKPVAAVVLVHTDEIKSVPLIIDFANEVGKKRVAKIAKQLGVKVLQHTRSAKLETELPKGTIVANVHQAFKVNAVFWFIAISGLALLATAGYVFMNWGLSPADGGVLKPLGERALFAAILALLAVLAVGGMQYYRTIYVIAMQREGETIKIHTAATGMKNSHLIRADSIDTIKHNKGKTLIPRALDAGRLTRVSVTKINTPWVTIKTDKPQRRFLIDMQAEFVDEPSLRALLKK